MRRTAVLGVCLVALTAGSPVAVADDGTALYSWGTDTHGGLAQPARRSPTIEPTPLQLPTIGGAPVDPTHLAVRDNDVFAVGSDGGLRIWYSEFLPGPERESTPVGPLRALAKGAHHFVGIDARGRLVTWGNELSGELGNGPLPPINVPNPIELAPEVTPTAVAAIDETSFAIGSNGVVYTWGSDAGEMLGNGSSSQSEVHVPTPLTIGNGATVVSISVGPDLAMVTTSTGEVYAWGQLLHDEDPEAASVPTLVPVTGARTAAAGDGFAVILTSTGQVLTMATGDRFGEMGNGPAIDPSPIPTAIALPSGRPAVRIFASASTAMAVDDRGATWVWGTLGGERIPTPVKIADRADQAPVEMVGTPWHLPSGDSPYSGAAAYFIGANRVGYAVGITTDLRRAAVPGEVFLPNGDHAALLSVGDHGLAVGDSGQLYAWGPNDAGQLGIGVGPGSAEPVPVDLPGGVKATSIAAGARHSVVVGDDGRLYAWGDNHQAQLGIGTPASAGDIPFPMEYRDRPTPVESPVGVTFRSVAAGDYHTVALATDGRVFTWGCCGGSLGRGFTFGRTTRPAPVTFPASAEIEAVVAGGRWSFALSKSGQVFGWGSPYASPTPEPLVPTLVPFPDAVAISRLSAGRDHVLAATDDGRWFAWGANDRGQLGWPTMTPWIPTPMPVPSTGWTPPGLTYEVTTRAGSAEVTTRPNGSTAPGQTTSLPSTGEVALGAGSSFASLLVNQWRADAATRGIEINYQDTGSTTGRDLYLRGQVDFAMSDIPFQPGEVSRAVGGRENFRYVPLVAGALSFGFRVADTNGQQISRLSLTPRLACRLFTDATMRWNDPALQAANPQVALPDADVRPVARLDQSGTTYVLMQYCIAVAPDVWSAFVERAGPSGTVEFQNGAPSPSFPATADVTLQPLSSGVARYVANTATGTNTVTYVESGTARGFNVPTADVSTPANPTTFVAPTPASVTRGLAFVDPNADGSFALDFSGNDPGAYFPSTYSYMIVPTTALSAGKGETLARFLYYALGDGQKRNEPLQYAKLPAKLIADGIRTADNLPGSPGQGSTTTTTSTAPTPTTAWPATTSGPTTSTRFGGQTTTSTSTTTRSPSSIRPTTTTRRPVPPPAPPTGLPPGVGALRVSAGDGTSVVLGTDGKLYQWGGQFGSPHQVPGTSRLNPSVIEAGTAGQVLMIARSGVPVDQFPAAAAVGGGLLIALTLIEVRRRRNTPRLV